MSRSRTPRRKRVSKEDQILQKRLIRNCFSETYSTFGHVGMLGTLVSLLYKCADEYSGGENWRGCDFRSTNFVAPDLVANVQSYFGYASLALTSFVSSDAVKGSEIMSGLFFEKKFGVNPWSFGEQMRVEMLTPWVRLVDSDYLKPDEPDEEVVGKICFYFDNPLTAKNRIEKECKGSQNQMCGQPYQDAYWKFAEIDERFSKCTNPDLAKKIRGELRKYSKLKYEVGTWSALGTLQGILRGNLEETLEKTLKRDSALRNARGPIPRVGLMVPLILFMTRYIKPKWLFLPEGIMDYKYRKLIPLPLLFTYSPTLCLATISFGAGTMFVDSLTDVNMSKILRAKGLVWERSIYTVQEIFLFLCTLLSLEEFQLDIFNFLGEEVKFKPSVERSDIILSVVSVCILHTRRYFLREKIRERLDELKLRDINRQVVIRNADVDS